MLITKEVNLKWNGYIKNTYVNKGYVFTTNGDEFTVKIEDVPSQAHIEVQCQCDICSKVFPKQYYSYTKSMNNGGITRCDDCKSLNKKKQEPKYNYNEVKEKCEQLGFELISKDTGVFADYVQVRCVIHTDIIQDKKIGDIFRNRGCALCSKDKERHTYEHIKSAFKEQGYTLLSETYVNAKSKLEYICNKHPFETQKTNYSEVKKYKTCKYCQGEDQSERQSHDIEFIRKFFESKDCELLSKEYINNISTLKYICNKHKERGIQETTFHSFRIAEGCFYCGIHKRSGVNHPFYNPQMSEKTRLRFRAIPGYGDWRLSVYKRDNWTCQICLKHNGKINAHHLLGFAENPNERVNVDNGVTVCPECHKEFHIKYTKNNNTPEQFYEFKRNKQEQLNILSIKEVI